MRPLHFTPGRLHPVPHVLAGTQALPQDVSSGLTISLEQSQFDLGKAFHLWPTPGAEKTYQIEGTHYIVHGRMSLRDFGIAMPVKVPGLHCFRVRIEWNSQVLDPRKDDGEQWILGTGVESVTETDQRDIIWLERAGSDENKAPR
jgi:hypothetical protein